MGFYRFPAGDMASDAFRPKAISWVMAGGLISAIIGPALATRTVASIMQDAAGTSVDGGYVVNQRSTDG